jgi:quercetin dioxygenase-like cupin family protein
MELLVGSCARYAVCSGSPCISALSLLGGKMADTHTIFDLEEHIGSLRSQEPYSRGRNSRTLVKYADLRVVLVAMKAGDQLHEHSAAGSISVQTIRGHIRMRAGGQVLDLPAGRLATLDCKVPHDVDAVEESAFLLTLGTPEHRGSDDR